MPLTPPFLLLLLLNPLLTGAPLVPPLPLVCRYVRLNPIPPIILDIFSPKSSFEYCSQTRMPDCDLFPIHLGRRLELCHRQLSRGGREEASFVKVEHVLDGPARDKGGDVGGELGCGGLHGCRRFGLTPLIRPSIDLKCLLEIPSPDSPFCSFGG
jgi:hypothetical protein